MRRLRTKDKKIDLYRGDCLEILDRLKENSVDSVICDPPYELGFMGKKWDSTGVAFQKETWEKALRVLKPGGYLLAFGGTRTYHRMTCAIEDAGFEIRDCISWIYSSGFPKSLDISKALDKAAGKAREVVGVRRGKGGQNINQLARPGAQDAANTKGCGVYGQGAKQIDVDIPITAPTTLEAIITEGYGTAIKPAHEPIVLAMKPLDGTYAENFLKWGVAGLNIGGCRIPTQDNLNGGGYSKGESKGMWTPGEKGGGLKRLPGQFVQPTGRWPANVVHDGSTDVTSLFPESSTTGKRSKRSKTAEVAGTTWLMSNHESQEYTDSGSAARFFYCTKVSKRERGEGNGHPTVKPLALMEYLCKLTRTPTGGIVLDPFMGSGSTGLACVRTKRKFIGIEIDKEYFKIAARRIKEELTK